MPVKDDGGAAKVHHGEAVKIGDLERTLEPLSVVKLRTFLKQWCVKERMN